MLLTPHALKVRYPHFKKSERVKLIRNVFSSGCVRPGLGCMLDTDDASNAQGSEGLPGGWHSTPPVGSGSAWPG